MSPYGVFLSVTVAWVGTIRRESTREENVWRTVFAKKKAFQGHVLQWMRGRTSSLFSELEFELRVE